MGFVLLGGTLLPTTFLPTIIRTVCQVRSDAALVYQMYSARMFRLVREVRAVVGLDRV